MREGISLAVVLAGLCLCFGLLSDSFLSFASVSTIANQLPTALTLAVAITFVLVIGEIDLSVGSVLAVSQGVMGIAMVQLGWSWPVAIGAALATGLLAGTINGFIVLRWQLPSFIVTLGMMEAARGGAYLVTDSRTVYIGTDIEWIAEVSWLGLSPPFLCAMLLVAIGQTALSRTIFGRYAIAIGTNQEAVRLAGIDTGRIHRRDRVRAIRLAPVVLEKSGAGQVSIHGSHSVVTTKRHNLPRVSGRGCGTLGC